MNFFYTLFNLYMVDQVASKHGIKTFFPESHFFGWDMEETNFALDIMMPRKIFSKSKHLLGNIKCVYIGTFFRKIHHFLAQPTSQDKDFFVFDRFKQSCSIEVFG